MEGKSLLQREGGVERADCAHPLCSAGAMRRPSRQATGSGRLGGAKLGESQRQDRQKRKGQRGERRQGGKIAPGRHVRTSACSRDAMQCRTKGARAGGTE